MASTDAKPVPRKNVAYRVTFPIYDADGDLVTGAASLDSETSGDAGTFADCTNEATEIATSSGMYYLDLTSTEMNFDTVAVIVKTSTSGAKTTAIVLYPEEAGDVRVNVTQISDDTTAADNCEAMFDGAGYAGGTTKLDVNVATIAANAITATAIAADAITAAKVADGTIDAATFAADAITAAKVAADVGAEIADAIWDEARAGHVAAGSFGEGAASVQGNVTGSVASVTGAVGSVTGNVGGNVTGSVGSVTGAVGSVTGAVGSVTAGVTVTTNNDKTGYTASTVSDKTGYALSSAGVQAIWDALTSALTAVGSIGKLLVDDINATISSRSTYAGADTAGTTTLLTRIVGTLATGTHTAQTGDSFARLGAPAGASVSADIAAVKVDTAATLADTGTDGVVVATASKTGYALSATGLDSIATTAPAGVASTFPGMVVQLWRRFFKKSDLTATQLKTYADDGSTTVTTQTVSDNGTTQTQGAAS